MNYSKYEQGDIIILPVPFSNLSESKLRPAIIISNNDFNSKYPDIIALKITSIGHNLPLDINLENNDLEQGELLKRSIINCAFIMTIEKNIISQKIGKVKNNKIREIKERLKELFN